MIRVSKAKPVAQRIDYGSAHLMVRPATAFQADLAGAAIGSTVLALATGEQAAVEVSLAIGDDLKLVDAPSEGWKGAVANRLALIELALVCIESWDGFVDEDDRPLELTRENIALVLRDVRLAQRVAAIINASIHEEAEEKNAFAPSLNGEAGAAEDTAQAAEQRASNAQAAA